MMHEPDPEHEARDRPDADRRHGHPGDQPEQQRDLAGPLRVPGTDVQDPGRSAAPEEEKRAGDVEHQQPVVGAHVSKLPSCVMETRDRHLKLLTETIEAVNSTLDLQEVLSQVATNVASALEADACFVYLYDERADELVLRATHGSRIDELTRRPRMRPGEGITGSAAASRAAVMIESQAHLDPRFKHFPNLPEDEYESILAVPILTRDGTLEGALNVRTREARSFVEDEVDLLLAIAAQVAQSIEHAKLYAEAQRRVHELEALARISEAVSNSLYLEESLEAIVKTTMDALQGDGRRPRARRRPHRVARRRRGRVRPSPAAALARQADRRARGRPRDGRSPKPTASCSPRSRPMPRWRWSTGAPSCGACSLRRSITASRTTSRRSPRCCASRHARRRRPIHVRRSSTR